MASVGGKLAAQMIANGFGQIRIGGAGDDFQVAEHEAALLTRRRAIKTEKLGPGIADSARQAV